MKNFRDGPLTTFTELVDLYTQKSNANDFRDGPRSQQFKPLRLHGNATLDDLQNVGVSQEMAEVLVHAPHGDCVGWGIPFEINDVVALAEEQTLTFWMGGAGAPIPVLMYHHIADLDDDASQGQRDWTVSPAALQEQLTYLVENNYESLSPGELLGYLCDGEPLPLRPVMITIDDGYQEIYDNARPLFAATSLRPVLFIVPGYVEYGAYMDWDTLGELVEQGFLVGSHSYDHSDLRQENDADLAWQIADSKETLEEHLPVRIDAFCYPMGSFDGRTLEVLAANHYTTAFSLNPTNFQHPEDSLFIGRRRVSYETTLDEFIELLPGW